MEGYDAKSQYYGAAAHAYDGLRFASIKGRWLDGREKRSITRAIAQLAVGSTVLAWISHSIFAGCAGAESWRLRCVTC